MTFDPERILGRVFARAANAHADPSGARPTAVIDGANLPRAPSEHWTGVPSVAGLEPELWREGERVTVDGGRGTVAVGEVEEVPVVTVFLQRPDGRVLLMRRSSRVGSFQGRWAAVSGFLEARSAADQAWTEVQEETGYRSDRAELLVEGRLVYARDGARVFTVHPFRFSVTDPEVHLDWEHSEFRWVTPEEFGRFETVPKLRQVWEAVDPPSTPPQGTGKR